MASAIRRPSTAFSNAPIGKPKKRTRDHDEAHLKWLRTLPCVISGTRPVEAAHIRYADPIYGKRETGKGEKPSDRWALPLSPDLHREQHAGSERAFWARYGIDPLRVASALFMNTGDDDQADVILREARNTAQSFGRLWQRGELSRPSHATDGENE